MATDISAPPKGILDCFPLEHIREGQRRALDWFAARVEEGFTDIVIAAPVGSGKSAVGIAIGHWLALHPEYPGAEGVYYGVTQRLLQDQIENDVQRYAAGLDKVETLKSAVNYPCKKYHNCGLGGKTKKKPKGPCNPMVCAYQQQRCAFSLAHVGVTNYPYLLTEHAYAGNLPVRQGFVLDEAHGVSKQILSFVELAVSQSTIEEYTPNLGAPGHFRRLADFLEWVTAEFMPELQSEFDIAETLSDSGKEQDKFADRAAKLADMMGKVNNALAAQGTQSEWVFWGEKDKRGGWSYTTRPVESAPFAHDYLLCMGNIRVYLSAYLGTKQTFCRDLGLAPAKVAWANVASTFDPANRPIYAKGIGSMSLKTQDAVLPSVLRVLEKIFKRHSDTKGICHVVSYALAEKVQKHFAGTPHAGRLLFPDSASNRDEMYETHCSSPLPTILVTPSMMEGYDFKDDYARWAVILKVPYASLGDKQVLRRMELDEDYYDQLAVSNIVQAYGRTCRSESDYADTYIFDSDFIRLYEKREELFPKWFREAVVIPE